jgi:ketosteroid isomerase-like protein
MSANDNKPTDEAQIRQLMETWAESVRAKHIDGILANHAPNILLFDVPPPVQSRGIEAYRKSWEQFFPWLGNSDVFEISDLSITAGGDVAFCHGLIRCGGTETSGDRVELVVRLTVCLRKINGQWTVVHEHHSEPSTST